MNYLSEHARERDEARNAENDERIKKIRENLRKRIEDRDRKNKADELLTKYVERCKDG